MADVVVRSESVGFVTTITLDSPENRNALSARLLEQLTGALETANADASTRVIVLTGAGNTFCAGADLKDPPGNTPGQRFSFPEILQTVQHCAKPVIARINGHVRAGGMGLTAACDIAIAPDDSSFAFSEVRIGVIPAIINVVCQPVMTPRAFRRYVITGEVFDGAEAARNGLVTVCVPRADLDGAVAAMAEELRKAAPSGIARSKLLIDDLPRLALDEQWTYTAGISAVQFQEPDAVEGIGAFPREAHTELGVVTLDSGAVVEAAGYFERWVGFRRRIDQVPGVQVAIVHGGELVASFAVGEADLDAHTPLTTKHLLRIASHSKTFTATSVMQLAERGALRLDDPLARWVPGVATADVTVRELLAHAGGLTRDGESADHWQLTRPFPDTAGLLAMTTGVVARNERFKYSNVGYALLGLVVAAASGQTYEEYVTENIVDRLGLADTGPELPPARESEVAVGYTGRGLGDRRVPIGHVNAGAMAAATGFYSTAEDLARYAAAHVLGDDRLLNDDSKRMMQHVAWQVAGFGAGAYGLGLGVTDVGGRTVVGHGGAYPGYITRTFVDPVAGLVVSVLTNAIDGPALSYATVAVKLVDLAAASAPDPIEDVDLRTFDGRFASLWGVHDLCVLGGRVHSFDLGLPDPTLQTPRLEVIDADTLRLADDGGYGSPGELLHVDRASDGTIAALRGGITSYPYELVAASAARAERLEVGHPLV